MKPTIRLKLFKNNKIVLNRLFRAKTRFFHLIGRVSWQKAYIKVLYIKEKDVFNDGEATNKKDLIKLYKDFTEANLIKGTYLKQWD